MDTISIITFNILAHVFTSPEWYPHDLDNKYLDRETRQYATINFITSMRSTTDIFCLQEVNRTEYDLINNVLKDEYYSHIVYHDKDYWREWIIAPLIHEPHGNAIFIKKSVFENVLFNQLSLLTGNYCPILSAKHIKSQKDIRLACIHFNTGISDTSDDDIYRNSEIESLINQFNFKKETVDIIAGDFNCTPPEIFNRNGFINVLPSIGVIGYTYPSKPESPEFNMIDHVLCRGGDSIKPFAGGYIFDFDIVHEKNETKRIEESLKICGSDHFPVEARIIL